MLSGVARPRRSEVSFLHPGTIPAKCAVRFGTNMGVKPAHWLRRDTGHLQTHSLAKSQLWLAEYFSFVFAAHVRGVLGVNFASGGKLSHRL